MTQSKDLMADLRIYTDGGARGNPGPSASAFVVVYNGKVIFKDSAFLGKRTNNEAEYSAVVMGLEWLTKNRKVMTKGTPTFFLDSELVTRQINGIYKVKSYNLIPFIEKARELLKGLGNEVKFVSISREGNKLADSLVNEKIDEKNG